MMISQIGIVSIANLFNPSLYGTLWAWYKRNTLVTLNGNNISAWGDSSGNGRTISQSTPSNQPLNSSLGNPIFDGSGDMLIMANNESCPANYTLLTLVRTTGQGVIMGFSGGGNNLAMYLGVGYSALYDLYTYHGNSSGYTLVDSNLNIVNTGTYMVLATKYVNGQISASLYRDGVSYAVTNTGSVTDSNAIGKFFMGGGNGCEVVETIIYSNAISDANIIIISNYLTTLKNYIPVGNIRSDNFTSSFDFTLNYTTNASSSFTTSSNGLIVSGGGGNYTKIASYNAPTLLEDWEMTGQITAGTVNSTSYGIAFGINSAGGYVFSSLLYLTTSGNVIAHTRGAYTSVYYSSDTLTVPSGGIVTFSIKRNKELFISTYTCNGVTIRFTTAVVVNTIPFPQLLPSTGKFSIYSVGGTHTLNNWTVKSSVRLNAPYLFYGDSITAGYTQSFAGTRWMNQAIQDVTTFIVRGGPGDTTTSLATSVQEVINLAPKKVFLLMGINDFYNSISLNTSMSNISSIVTALENAGITVYICKLLPCNDYNVNDFNDTLITNFGLNRVKVDFYSSLVGSGTNINPAYSSDGLHPNATCAGVMATILNNAGVL